MTDSLCWEGLRRAGRSLKKAYLNGGDVKAREDMAVASLFGGLALANAKLGAIHGLAGPIGGMFPGPHGALCARLLPFVMEVNIRALEARAPDHHALQRYQQIARLLTEDPRARASQGVDWARSLVDDVHISPLAEYGISEDQFPEIIKRASVSSSMRGNPIELTPDEMEEILTLAL
jgi:alcohol dehydrogenase class IV